MLMTDEIPSSDSLPPDMLAARPLTVAMTCEALTCSRAYLYRLIWAGHLKLLSPPGNHPRIDPDSVRKLQKSGMPADLPRSRDECVTYAEKWAKKRRRKRS